MKRYTVILILTLFGTMILLAQTPLERMNSIKVSDEYYWDEYTHPSADTAAIGAVRRLQLYIDVPDGRTLTENDIMPSVKFIKMKRTTLTRVFAYIKKKDVESIIHTGKSEDKVEVTSSQLSEEKAKPEFVPMPLAKELMEKSDFYIVYNYIKNLHEKGEITGYGPLKDAENIENDYLVIFDKQTQRIVCVLSPALIGENRTNLVSGVNDTLSRYEEGKHVAIWYSMKQ